MDVLSGIYQQCCVCYSAGGTISFNIGDRHLYGGNNDFDPEVIAKRFQIYVDRGQWAKWEMIRAPFRDGEESNIYNVFLV